MTMRVLLSKAERDFLQNLIKGKIDKLGSSKYEKSRSGNLQSY